MEKIKKVGQVHGELIISPILKLKNNGLDGYEWTEKEYAIFPTFHPASIFYNRQLNEKIQADLLLFKKLIQSKNER
ncbi:Uracil-DNA glycosylase superfamily (fragment) [Carnobacterium maltaromaticum]